jgi:hypothetical protein
MSPPPTRRTSLKSAGPSGVGVVAEEEAESARMAAHATSPDRCGRNGAAGLGEQEAAAAATAVEGEQSKERRERLEQRARLPALLAELRLELGAPVEDAVSRSDSPSSATAGELSIRTASFSVAGGFMRPGARTAATIDNTHQCSCTCSDLTHSDRSFSSSLC